MRKVIQLHTETQYQKMSALCDDGSMWYLETSNKKWERMPDVPQDEETKSGEPKEFPDELKEGMTVRVYTYRELCAKVDGNYIYREEMSAWQYKRNVLHIYDGMLGSTFKLGPPLVGSETVFSTVGILSRNVSMFMVAEVL